MRPNASRVWLPIELKEFAAGLPDNGLVLDAGAGSQTYASIFSRQIYESADFEQVDKYYKPSTYVCDLSKIPVEDNRFDAVVFTQVLEHLPEPQAVLAELNRVLKPGGRMFLSAPLFYQEHEQPYDFYRYTQFGLKYMLERNGFKILEMRWLEGYLATVAHQLRYMLRNVPRSPQAYGGGIMGIIYCLTFLGFGALASLVASVARASDVRHRVTSSGMPLNYLVFVEKIPTQATAA